MLQTVSVCCIDNKQGLLPCAALTLRTVIEGWVDMGKKLKFQEGQQVPM